MAPVIRESLEQAAPRPQTAVLQRGLDRLQRTLHPPSSVNAEDTAEEAADLIMAVLRREELL